MSIAPEMDAINTRRLNLFGSWEAAREGWKDRIADRVGDETIEPFIDVLDRLERQMEDLDAALHEASAVLDSKPLWMHGATADFLEGHDIPQGGDHR